MSVIEVICAWCGAHKWSDGTWHLKSEFELIKPDTSHGICDECSKSMHGELNAISRQKADDDKEARE